MTRIALLTCALLLLGTTTTTAQEITMFPGFWKMKYFQDEQEISKRQAESILLADPEAGALLQKSKRHNSLSWVAVGAQAGFFVWQLTRASNQQSQTGPLIGVLGAGAVAIGFSISSTRLRRESILTYNSNADLGRIDFGPTRNGVGLVWSIR